MVRSPNLKSKIAVAKDVEQLGIHTLIGTGVVEISHIFLSNHISCNFVC